jgi:ABC transporter, ATP-binding protein
VISIHNLTKEFNYNKQKVTALENVTFTIEKGDIFGIIGFSGAGKSTLLRMINALEVPTTGYVEIDGVNINSLNFNELRKIRKRIGMVFQQFNLLNAKSVYDNVAIPLVLNGVPKKTIDKKVKSLLAFVDLSDKANAYPDELSGGQKQRVGIARALATDPSILLCDEATSALDPDTTESILQLLERVNRELGITIVIVTHEIDVIQKICNRVAVMEKGHLIEEGSVLQVFSKPKHNTTKRFVRTVIPDEIPTTVKHTLACEKREYTILKMHFLGSNTTDNVLHHINKIYDLETSVLFATVTELEHTVLGVFIVQFIGNDLEVGKVKEYLLSQAVDWEEVEI